jgi:gliding motility-associated-like protein
MKPLNLCNRLFPLCFLLFSGFMGLRAQAPQCHWISEISGPNVQSVSDCASDDSGNLYTLGFKIGKTKLKTFFDSSYTQLEDTVNFTVFLTKTNAAGGFVWSREIVNFFSFTIPNIRYDNNGYLYLVGTFTGMGVFDLDNPAVSTVQTTQQDASIYMAKFDTSGSFVWVKQLDGLKNKDVLDVHVKNNGSFTIAGSFDSTLVFNSVTLQTEGSQDAFVAEFDSGGNELTIKSWGTAWPDYANSVCYANDGAMYVALVSYGNTLDADPSSAEFLLEVNTSNSVGAMVVKFDSGNQFEWAKRFQIQNFSGGFGAGNRINCVRMSPSGLLHVAGLFSGIIQSDLNEMAGSNFASNDSTALDAFIGQYDADGNVSWFRHIDSGVFFNGIYQDMLFDQAENVITSGFFYGNTDFDPGNALEIRSTQVQNGYIWCLNSQGDFRWVRDFDSPETATWIHGIAFGSSTESIYAIGYYNGLTRLGDGPEYTINPENDFSGTPSVDGFIVKYSTCDLITSETELITCDTVFQWNGQTLSESGVFLASTENDAGCDSISILRLQLGQSFNIQQNLAICTAQLPYSWNGLTFSEGGSQTALLSSTSGCDSTVTLNLSVGDVTSYTDVQTACEAFTWIDGITYSGSTNTPVIVLSGASSGGCDSVVTLNLTILQNAGSVQNITECGVYENELGQVFTQNGSYTLSLTAASGCDSVVTFNINILPLPVVVAASSVTTVNQGQSVELSASGASSYQWLPSDAVSCDTCPNTQAFPTTSASYIVIGTDSAGCTQSDTLRVEVDIICNEVFIPTIFSPNGKGPQANEAFCVLSECVEQFKLVIHNRWGEMIFATEDITQCWDGKFKGVEAATGVYAYNVYLKQLDGRVLSKAGTVELVK